MRDIVDAVAASIVAEVAGADSWTVEKFDPVWRNPAKGEVLSVYGTYLLVGAEVRSNGLIDDVHQIVVEYTESAGDQVERLSRDAAAEIAAYEQASALRDWAKDH